MTGRKAAVDTPSWLLPQPQAQEPTKAATPPFSFAVHSFGPGPAADGTNSITTPTTVNRQAQPAARKTHFEPPDALKPPAIAGRVFAFGTGSTDAVAQAVSQALKGVPAAKGVTVPNFAFGSGKASIADEVIGSYMERVLKKEGTCVFVHSLLSSDFS